MDISWQFDHQQLSTLLPRSVVRHSRKPSEVGDLGPQRPWALFDGDAVALAELLC